MMTDSQRDILYSEIVSVLTQKGVALDLPNLEFYIQAARVERGQPIVHLDTFAVRDAISDLIEASVIRRIIGSGVELIPRGDDVAEAGKTDFLDGLNDDFGRLASDPEACDDHRREMKEMGL